jgi:transcriptional regulator with XRE-family HTH domain
MESEVAHRLNLGEGVLERRQALHITQQDLARSLGVTPQHISLIEQNKVTPSIALLAGLATELGVSVDYLVSGKEGIITDTIPAIKADKRLKIKAKKALIAMVEELYAADDTVPATVLSRDSGEPKK